MPNQSSSYRPASVPSVTGQPARRRHRGDRPNPSDLPRRRPRATEVNALDVTRDAFTALVIGPRRLSLDGSDFPGLPDRRLPLTQLRTLLLARSCPQQTRDAVWRELITRSRREGGAWTVGCVGVALPALTRSAAQLTARFADDPADIVAAVLAGFVTALSSADLDRPRVMLRLRWAAYRAGRIALAEALQAPPPAPAGAGSLLPHLPWGHPDLVLARAVAEGAITRLEADVIGSTRLEDTAVADWAAAHGLGTWAVYKFRKRAEQRLAAYLLEVDSESDVDLAVPSTRLPATGSAAVPDRSPTSTREAAEELSKTSAETGVQLRRQVLPAHRVPEDPRCA